FSDAARQWAGIAGDTPSELRLYRSDFGNFLMTRIEQEIQFAKEAIEHHYLGYLSTTGLEAENQARSVKLYVEYIRRLRLSKNEVERGIAGVWPYPRMLKAALTERREGGTHSVLSAAQIRELREVLDPIRQSGETQQIAPPPEDSEETAEGDSKE
ncbi:MAG: hypothetical protein ACW99G_12645, partial [Candidatus Thorarchaeota archaeon]